VQVSGAEREVWDPRTHSRRQTGVRGYTQYVTRVQLYSEHVREAGYIEFAENENSFATKAASAARGRIAAISKTL
jgi:hypothetical protein